MAGFIDALPHVNAALNATSATLVLLGWRAIRRGRVSAHWRFMVSAAIVSAVFLVFYLIRWSQAGTTRFEGAPWERTAYLVLLFSHMTLAILVVPLVIAALWLAVRRRFDRHVRVVRWTLPVWLYVSTTGILVYLALYWYGGGKGDIPH